ncbi:teichuronic acid biosynthesis glycosyltransferase TuaG [Evansella caseinilytica]|uniref:Teichuronic acid biosynthesis glycosyltransferase TuaG n=1 Tax=Evansella caseinilytica TaxID=1503961 RepID=A0A1H3TZV2_9BACI|nr:glycosyltransferase family 2 protein [Evansella caseinilytica]SDZ55628.1 teichuronic acid biosynthesis glycosyltransferase TuaG [Evansella caseinilytica]
MLNKDNDGKPLISVITPAYNSEKFIGTAIDSVAAQTYSNWEMIIVDDGSTDKTINIIEKYKEKDNRIRLVQLKENSGPAVARNIAIREAGGRYLAFLDSDDQWLPEKLEKQLRFMQEKQIAFSFTKYKTINERGEDIGKIVPIPDKADYKLLLKQNVIGCLTVMIDQEQTGEVQMVNIRTRQDYVLWLHLCKRGFSAYGLQEILSVYRLSDNSISSNKLKMAKQNWRVYREIEKLSLIKSIWYFMNYIYYKSIKYLT